MGIDPMSAFYMTLPIANANGTVDAPDADGAVSSLDQEEVLTHAKDSVEDNGGVMIIYKCIPVKRVSAYRVKVEDIGGTP